MGKVGRIALTFVVVLGAAALIAWAASYVSPLTPRASEEWSRGRVIGTSSVNRPVALCPAPPGGVYLVWSNADDRLELARIDPSGRVVFDQVLAVSEKGRDPQLRVDGAGRLHLLWREEGDGSIRYVLLDPEGGVLQGPQTLSETMDGRPSAPRLIQDAVGDFHALWVDADGVQWALIEPDGGVMARQTLFAVDATTIAAQMDRDGYLHLAWQRASGANKQSIEYAVFVPETGDLAGPERLAEVFLRMGQRVDGPTLGLDLDTAYVLWVVEDLREISSEAQYAYFLIGLPQERRVETIQLERGRDPTGVAPLEGQRSPLLVALSEVARSESGRMEPQIALLALVRDQMPDFRIVGPSEARSIDVLSLLALGPGGGVAWAADPGWSPILGAETEHIVTASDRPSLRPTIAADAYFDLHLAWLEPGGFGRYRVVYASTASGVKQAYNAITPWDLADQFFSLLMRLSLVALAIGPMTILWALLPLTALAFYYLVSSEEDLRARGPRLMLGGVLLLEVVLTFIFPPHGQPMGPAFRWGVPAGAAVVAGAVTVLFVRRREGNALFLAFFVFTAIDMLLQLLLYFAVFGLN
ncbi:MAG TPA: hypothetical protein G4O00_00255 [Thermoflexia bacterium]|jgi:hypothetical protein|nr:hypothetical protein [Thermoflexia bacterium]